MGDVINGNFPNCHKMTLAQAKEFLGHNWFKKGICNASIEELEMAVNNPEAIISGAAEAYKAILEYRTRKLDKPQDDRPLALVIPLIPLKKAA